MWHYRGYLSDNGFKNGSDSDQHPAYAAIDLQKSNNFIIDTNSLTLRSDEPVSYMLNIYIDSVIPPLYHPNLEFNIIVNVKDDEDNHLRMTIFANKEEAETGFSLSNKLYAITNYDSVDDSRTSGTEIITFLVVNNQIVLKTLSPGLF